MTVNGLQVVENMLFLKNLASDEREVLPTLKTTANL